MQKLQFHFSGHSQSHTSLRVYPFYLIVSPRASPGPQVLERRLCVDSAFHLDNCLHTDEWGKWNRQNRQSGQIEGKVKACHTDKGGKGVWERPQRVRSTLCIRRNHEKRSWAGLSQIIKSSHVMLKGLDFILQAMGSHSRKWKVKTCVLKISF